MTSIPQWFQSESGDYVLEAQLPLKHRFLRWVGRQTWILRGHDRLLRLLYNPDANKHFKFEVDFFGQRYRGDLGHFIDWNVFCYGSYAYHELLLLRDIAGELKTLRTAPISFYDVGANVGNHTLFMAPHVDKIFAFEPFGLVRAFIEDKIALNGLTNVTIFPFALGETDGDVPYYPSPDGNSGAGTLIENRLSTSADPAIVQIRRGDSFLKKENLPRIDLIKADVEGFEAFVFRGLSDRIRQDKPAIILEISEDSRKGFGSEDAFRQTFYEGALFAEVAGGNGRPYKLKPFKYDTAEEVLVMPPELSGLMKKLTHGA